MRNEPTGRIPLGILGLLAALLAYAWLIARFIAPLFASWPTLVQMLIYLGLGIVWLLPLRRFLIWMETGSWRNPE